MSEQQSIVHAPAIDTERQVLVRTLGGEQPLQPLSALRGKTIAEIIAASPLSAEQRSLLRQLGVQTPTSTGEVPEYAVNRTIDEVADALSDEQVIVLDLTVPALGGPGFVEVGDALITLRGIVSVTGPALDGGTA